MLISASQSRSVFSSLGNSASVPISVPFLKLLESFQPTGGPQGDLSFCRLLASASWGHKAVQFLVLGLLLSSKVKPKFSDMGHA